MDIYSNMAKTNQKMLIDENDFFLERKGSCCNVVEKIEALQFKKKY